MQTMDMHGTLVGQCAHVRERNGRINESYIVLLTFLTQRFGRLKTPSKGYVWKLALTREPEMITLFQSKTAELLKQKIRAR